MNPQINIRRYAILAVVLLLVLLAGIWLYGHSFMSIKVTGASQEKLTYRLTNQASNKTTEFTSSETSVRRLVSRGSYQITVVQNDKNGFVINKASGFLTSTNADIALESESARTFVGNNPLGCSYYSGSLLMSYECTDVRGASIHLPSTNSSPTYTKRTSNFSDRQMEGVLQTKEGIIVLGQSNSANSEEEIPAHQLYLTDQQYNVKKLQPVNGYSASQTLVLKPYAGGFLVADKNAQTIYAYAALGTVPTKLTPNAPKDKKQKAYYVSGNDTSYLVAYSTDPDSIKSSVDGPSTVGAKTSVVITTGKDTATLSLGERPEAVELCGQSKLCVLNDRVISVYAYSGKSVSYLYKVTGVEAMNQTSSGLVFIQNKAVWQLDVDKQAGYIAYSFGTYSFCGLSNATSGYVLCAIDARQNKVALYIDPSKANTDSLDKKIAEVQKSPDVSRITTYGNILYISPVTGAVAYNPSLNGYGYDQADLSAKKQRINAALQQAGIDTSKYSVKYTL